MSEWRDVTLGEVLTLQRGFDLTEKEATAGPFPVISSGGPAYTTDVAKVDGPGVVTGRKGVLGKVHFSSGPFWPHDTTLWVKDFKGADPRYVFYLLQTLPLAALDAGASNPTLNRNHAHLLPVRVPPRAVQQRISWVLGSIDDLIESNRRRVVVLDEMASLVYREWFVRLRYPGHEDDSLVDSSLGPIPDGWEPTSLGEIAVIDRTSVQPARSPREIFVHFSIPAFDHDGLPSVDEGRSIRSGKYLVTAPAVLVSKLNPRIERTWLVEPTAERRSVASTEFLVLRPATHLPLEFIYLMARSEPFQVRLRELSGGTSTSHQRARPADFLRLTVLAPAPQPVARFTDVIRPQLQLARDLRANSGRLAVLRDVLLPRLLTGQIDVSSLRTDALLEEAVA